MGKQGSETIILRGGLDLVTPGLAKKPGSVIGCLNYEVTTEGVRRCDGYERFDGRPRPSQACEIKELAFTAGTAATPPAADQKVTGQTSGATGYLVETPTVTSGTFAGADAVGTMLLRNVTGTFTDTETLYLDDTDPFATADGTQTFPAWENDTTKNTYCQTAIEAARDQIGPLGGTGDTRGLATLDGTFYAWRDNEGGEGDPSVGLYKATAGGWVLQTFGQIIDFDAATAAFAEDETLTGGTSGATSTIKRVVLTSGAWDGTGAGYLVLDATVTGGPFQDNEAITSASGAAVANGANSNIYIPQGGRVRAVTHNFYGASNLRRLYFANGGGTAFEWDGTVLAPIRSGVETSLDKPTHIGVHSNHLLLGFDGGHLVNSGTGTPLSYLALDGAGAYGLGEDITGIVSNSRTATLVTGRNKIAYFTGNDVNDFVLQEISDDSGARENTIQLIDQPYFVDDIGLRSMASAATFGDWKLGTQSDRIEPLFKTKKAAGLSIVGSVRVRGKNQYRLFYNDGSGISFHFGGKIAEPMTFDLGFTPTCFLSGEDTDGDEILLAGADDGYVYQLDAGQSHDGTAMEYFVRFTFQDQRYPDHEKRYRWVLLEATGEGATHALTMVANYDYGDGDVVPNLDEDFTVRGAGGFYDTAVWDEFYFDNPTNFREWLELNGVGANVSYVFFGTSTYENPHVLSALTTKYTLMRASR